MSTSAQVREARHYKEYLKSLRKEETFLFQKLEKAQADFKEYPSDPPDALETLIGGINRSLKEVREAIENTKAILATKVHINTKSESRKARQDAAKKAKGNSR